MIDYLLIQSSFEGGSIPLIEALTCGTITIAPEIGLIPKSPYISYIVDDLDDLKLTDHNIDEIKFLSSWMNGFD